MSEKIYVNEEAQSLNKFLVRSFLYMGLGLAVTAITAYFTWATGAWRIFSQNTFLLLGCILLEFGLVIYLTNRIRKLKLTAAYVSFFLYAVVNGLTFSFLFLAYNLGTLFMAFGFSAVLFINIAIIGHITKRDLTRFGNIIFAALITLIIVTACSIMFRISGLDMILSYIGIAIFMAFTAYDVQMLKKMYYSSGSDEVRLQAFGIYGALQLYLDFINLFIYILRLINRRK